MFEYETFMEGLTDRGVDWRCELCGGGDWRFGDQLFGLPFVGQKRDPQPQGGLAVAACACFNCGHLRLFVPSAIEDQGRVTLRPSDPDA
jgi:hypothetical protein